MRGLLGAALLAQLRWTRARREAPAMLFRHRYRPPRLRRWAVNRIRSYRMTWRWRYRRHRRTPVVVAAAAA